MGCGGSRTDALEPRYLESWTKETESTWLTSTDTDIPLSSIQNIPYESSEADFTSEKTISTVCSAVSEAGRNDMQSSSPPAGLGSPAKGAGLPSTGTRMQRRSVLQTEEITKWQDRRMATKQVTITVTQSIHQVDKNGKVKKSLTTYEVRKPADALKKVASQNT